MPELVEFRLSGCDEVSKPKLRTICHVEHLFLNSMTTTSFSSVVFRNLVSLTIHNLEPFRHSEAQIDSKISLVEPASLANQLDMMQVVIGRIEGFPADLLKRDVPVLLTFSLAWADELSTCRRFQHFHLMAWEDSDYFSSCKPTELLQKLVEIIASHTQIKSLSLPYQLHSSSSSSLHPDQHSTRDDLLSTCASRGLDIIWRLGSKKPVDDEAVSRDFWRYAKELKRKKAMQAEGGGGNGNA
ncbi:hypothetical protein JCM8547_002647 [Rhodosporidiobolus lusitaniae]